MVIFMDDGMVRLTVTVYAITVLGLTMKFGQVVGLRLVVGKGLM
jgi:hypothetical protein